MANPDRIPDVDYANRGECDDTVGRLRNARATLADIFPDPPSPLAKSVMWREDWNQTINLYEESPRMEATRLTLARGYRVVEVLAAEYRNAMTRAINHLEHPEG